MPMPFRAQHGKIWHGAQESVTEDGRRALTLAFPVCQVNDDLTAPEGFAQQIAAGLNLLTQLPVIDRAAVTSLILLDHLQNATADAPPVDLLRARADLEHLRAMIADALHQADPARPAGPAG